MTDSEILWIRDEMLPSQGESFDTLAFGRSVAMQAASQATASLRNRQPLSQDAVLDFAEGCTLQFHDLLEFARKVERAHGIGA
jgi:hypothetical protein